MLQEIYLNKSNKVLPPAKAGVCPTNIITSFSKNINDLGFALSHDLILKLKSCTKSSVLTLFNEMLPILKKMVGAHKKYKPFYPNFPQQVMDASEAELYENAMMHYYGFMLSDKVGDPSLTIMPNYETEIRPILDEFHNLRMISCGDDEDFKSIFTKLLAGNSSTSESDKEIISWFAKNYDVKSILPEVIPQKENLAYLIGVISDITLLSNQLKTATDVLRVAAVLSQGDVSLAESTKFKKFSNKERKFLLSCLENCNNLAEDMLRYKGRWVRLGELIHPGSYAKRFPKTYQAFDLIRNNKKISTFNGKVEAAIKTHRVAEIVTLLSQRPGDFARRLDHILRTCRYKKNVVNSFLSVADKVATPVLLQVFNHFKNRSQELGYRAFFPKGNIAKIQYKEGDLDKLDTKYTDQLVKGIADILSQRFSTLPPLGKTYIDINLIDQIVPFSQRSASKSLRTVSRGSKFALDEGNTIRFFIWWTNNSTRVDIDLSVMMLDENWSPKGSVSFTRLRDGDCCHSGDITSAPAPQGACEFIDVNLESLKDQGSRYVVMNIYSFTGQKFSDIECFGGWMMRKSQKSGEVFEPKTVKDRIDVTSETIMSMPVIIDVVDRKVCWVDLGLTGGRNHINGNTQFLQQTCKAMMNLNKPNLYDLLAMHVAGRGEFVETPEEAETIFDINTAYDIDTIKAEYLV